MKQFNNLSDLLMEVSNENSLHAYKYLQMSICHKIAFSALLLFGG